MTFPYQTIGLNIVYFYSLDLFICCRIFGILLVFVDVSLVIADLLTTDRTMYVPLEYRSISLSIALYFLMDVLLRVFLEG